MDVFKTVMINVTTNSKKLQSDVTALQFTVSALAEFRFSVVI